MNAVYQHDLLHAGTGYYDITQHEIEALKTMFNMADAHTHQEQSPSQKKIVNRLPELWYSAENSRQHDLEQKFIRRFFELQEQPTILQRGKTLLTYAASISMAIVSTYLRQKNMFVSLIDPCFDNLHDLLKNMRVPLEPVEEELLHDATSIYDNLCRRVTGDALCLVDPNNPTGFTLMRHGMTEGFEQVVKFCKDKNKTLILDLCFAPFALIDKDMGRFDIYKLLEESGITYITMEDTGKTWPVQDAKCALYTASDDIYDEIYNIHTTFLLNVSPFLLNMLSEYLEDSKRDKGASVRHLLEHNRSVAKRALAGTCLEYCEPDTKVSVGWFKIKDSVVKATELQQLGRQREIYILPGTFFFWSRREEGERYVRIAFARRPEVFARGIECLRDLLNEKFPIA
jgi:aspartate/methionine/tyrosine aminotransferase